MEQLMSGRVVMVTGAGHGLGRAFALDLGRAGATVVVNDLAASAGGKGSVSEVVEAIEAEGGAAVAAEGSVVDEDAVGALVESVVDSHGHIDGVVNNAGIVYGAPFEETSVDDFRRMLDVHVVGSFLVSRAVLPHMQQQGYGRIVNIASNAGAFGMARMASYSTAKAAILGLTSVLAIEGRASGVLANAVLPMANTNPGRTAGAEAIFARLEVGTSPAFVAPLITFLCSERCTETHGIFSAAGGRYARAFVAVTPGWYPDDPDAVDAGKLGEHLREICDPSDYEIPSDMLEEVEIIARRRVR